ncbi:tetratricopeptide repeat protein [Roseomonas sp. KE0001]|uniref:tetratricopeptide repeat protein n=1 Tax=Roseomonas sp. KE0001 TaxID=2479201 RepID=UPI00272C0FD9|nr:tetratricopeptide repeat protein [Roseomonas sp. KE0001]
MREASARHAGGDLARAEALYRQVLARDPREANAMNLLGVLHRQRGDLPGALRLIRRALALRPEAPVFLAALGGALAEAGRLEEAVDALRAALARRPDDAVSLRNLGQALCALGRPGEALAPLRRAVALAPRQGEAHLALAHGLREAGDPAAALEAARAAMALPGLSEALARQAGFLLAALGGAAAPARAPAAYVRDLFDQYAPRFAAELTQRLGYRTPEALAELLRDSGVEAARRLRVLDLGCGTGLSGLALAPFAARLEGLDLSPCMLAEAARQGCYDALHEADLLDFLPGQAGRHDLIAAADVLNYLGDLAPALRAMRQALRPGGLLAFSVELGEGPEPFALGPGLRYRHAPDPLRACCAAAGLLPVAERGLALRRERDQPVPGLLLLLRGPAS